MGFDTETVEFEALIERVLSCFRPTEFSGAITCDGAGNSWGENGCVKGYGCENEVKQELAGGGHVLYRCFTVAEKEMDCELGSPKSILHCWDEDSKEEVIVDAVVKKERKKVLFSCLCCFCDWIYLIKFCRGSNLQKEVAKHIVYGAMHFI